MAQNPDTTQVTPPASAPAAGGGGNSKLLLIIVLSNVLMVGAVAFLALRKPSSAGHETAATAEKSEKGEKAEKGEKSEKGGAASGEHGGAEGAGGVGGAPGPILKLENFIIQLRAVDQDRYVRISFDLEVGNDSETEIVKRRMAHIRDAVISYFSDRTLDELRGSEGIERTKQALMKRLDELLPGKIVRAIYITDFIIQ